MRTCFVHWTSSQGPDRYIPEIAVLQYAELNNVLRTIPRSVTSQDFAESLLDYLVEEWLQDYESYTTPTDIVQVTDSGFSYLFDIENARLIAAWGISTGRHGDDRDAARMRGFPMSAGPLYHKGHAISHRLGGSTDINLLPQLGRINNGPFKRLETRAVNNPGAFYFTYWSYRASPRGGPNEAFPNGFPGQTPSSVDQGLLIPGQPPQLQGFVN